MNQILSFPPGSALGPLAGDETPQHRIRLGRRGLLSTALAAGGGLLIGVSVGRPGTAAAATPGATVATWVIINPDNTVKVWVPAAEMGQGIASGLAQILAEELPLDWTKVSTESVPYGAIYASPFGQITGGSFSTRTWFQPMLKAGAAIRELLVAAAAAQWKVPATGLQAKPNNSVFNPATGLSLTYGALAPAAALLTPPASPALLSAAGSYKVVGQPVLRPDIPLKVNGSAIFGCDIVVPGMAFASIQPAPVFGATVKTMPAKPAGVLALVNLGDAVAVVANNTWTAINAAIGHEGQGGLATTWNIPAGASAISSSAITTQANGLLSHSNSKGDGTSTAAVAEKIGNLATSMAQATKTLTLTYSQPYLPHAPMETMNCTASVTATSAEIWVPTQAPDWVANTVHAITGLPLTAITVHATLIGGASGRKIEQDYVAQAVKTAKAYGKPVKLTWARETDFGHDFYRPMSVSRVVAGIDAGGNILGWYNTLVAPSVSEAHWPGSAVGGLDMSALDGAVGSAGLDYAMGSRMVDYQLLRAGVPVGWWRSVGHSYNCFVVESAIDELALAAKIDPLAYRQKLLAGQPRQLAVLNAAASLAGWGTALPAGSARGIAFSDGFGSLAALVLELAKTTSASGAVSYKVTKAFCAIDCGTAVNPNQIEAQMQGGLAQGLGAARWGGMQFNGGRTQQLNFDNYKMLKMRDMPVVQTKIVTFPGAPLGGIGETMVPPVAPALANAYAALTGIRKRSVPVI